MAAAIYNFTIEKGTDFSLPINLTRSNGDPINILDSGVCINSQIVEFYGIPPITGFSIQEVSQSGVILSLSKEATSILPFEKCYYDVVLNVSGVVERVLEGEIYTSEQATINFSCQ